MDIYSTGRSVSLHPVWCLPADVSRLLNHNFFPINDVDVLLYILYAATVEVINYQLRIVICQLVDVHILVGEGYDITEVLHGALAL